MKVLYFFVGAILSTAVVADPNQDGKQQGSTCKLTNLIPPDEGFQMPEIDIDGHTNLSIEDPLNIQNSSITLDQRVLKGKYSLMNGVVEGLSTLTHDFSYSPLTQRVTFNASLQRVHLTGIYEIVDGKANLTTLGEHAFYGEGPLNTSVTGLFAGIGLTLQINPQTRYLSIGSLKIDFEFDSAYITAENLVVDGVPVDWEKVNQSIRPLYEALWVGQHDVNVQLIQNEINRLLEGCTFMDLLELLKPPPSD